jgi:ribosome-binding protein aMBF1 (putative translation factor)
MSQQSLSHCDICGKQQPSRLLFLIPIEDKWLQVCANCYPHAFSCATCEHLNNCDVQSDKSGIKKVVMVTRQQGPVTIQQQEINPTLVEKYCITCHCHADFGCRKITPNDDEDCPHWSINSEILDKI